MMSWNWLMADWREVVGSIAAVLVFVTFFERCMFRLRCWAIAGNVFFIAYAILRALHPVLILHTCLLPMNIYRLWQLMRERKRQA
ncbi:MAG: hypothetical protein DHS20C10_11810 [marine bacterium B5-7]|nr:MAG: hypothetical protein DHS20C10_11810 [marine bacterium B5-7]